MVDSLQTSPDARQQQLACWVSAQINTPQKNIALRSIASDAGFRRYFRFATPSQWLAVDAPPLTEDSRQFVAIARFLSAQGVHTPAILASDENQGFLLVEDFGDQLLFTAADDTNADAYYKRAIDSLLRLQGCPDNLDLIPRYDQALLHRELEIFSEWFVEKLLDYPLSEHEKNMLSRVFAQLEQSALAQPQCLVHRDYHSRNLLIQTDKTLGVIDFQGALWGAVTYDLVSLLRDCYKRWPANQVKSWALYYHSCALKSKRIEDNNTTPFLRSFDWMGLQRHIKVLGIFARLHLRDNKPNYLNDLPLVIRYTLEIAEQYSELETFAAWFSQTLIPLAQKQAWYTDYRSAGDSQ